MSRTPALWGAFDLGSEMRGSQRGWRDERERKRQVEVSRRTCNPAISAIAFDHERAPVTS